MKIRALAHQVADDLHAAEDAIDTAIAMAAKLAGTMTAARRDANVSAVVGQDVFDGMTETFASLNAARRSIVQTHHGLVVVKDQVGLRTVAVGGAIKPPMVTDLKDVA